MTRISMLVFPKGGSKEEVYYDNAFVRDNLNKIISYPPASKDKLMLVWTVENGEEGERDNGPFIV